MSKTVLNGLDLGSKKITGLGTPAAVDDAAQLGTTFAGFCGDGSDGNATISGTTTLTKDMYYDTLTVQNGGVLNTGGFRIFCKTLCQVDSGGTIQRNGTNAASATAATGLSNGTVGGSTTGGNGTTGAGSTPSNPSNVFGGLGTAGGNGASGAGSSGQGSAPSASLGNPRALPQSALGTNFGFSAITSFTGGGPSGGGGGDGTNSGGGAGSGGGVLVINARRILNNGTISANGGNGFSPASGNCGGGGAGPGGVVLLNCSAYSGSGTYTANAGTPGTKSGTGTNGATGNAGKALLNIWS